MHKVEPNSFFSFYENNKNWLSFHDSGDTVLSTFWRRYRKSVLACTKHSNGKDEFSSIWHASFILTDMCHCRPQLQSSNLTIDEWSTANQSPRFQTLLTMKVKGPLSNTTLQTELPARPPFVSNFLNKTEADIQRRFVLEADPNFSLNRLWFTNGTTYRYYQLDNTSIVIANVTVFSKMPGLAIILTLNTLYKNIAIPKELKLHFYSIDLSSITGYKKYIISFYISILFIPTHVRKNGQKCCVRIIAIFQMLKLRKVIFQMQGSFVQLQFSCSW